jgi:hypothetical protein
MHLTDSKFNIINYTIHSNDVELILIGYKINSTIFCNKKDFISEAFDF